MSVSSTKKKPLLPLFCFLFFLTVQDCCSAVNIITPTQPITYSQTITSSGEIFRLSFFSFGGNSKNRYVGIWYNKIPRQNIVWIASRENPLKDSSGALAIANDGNLAVLDGQLDVPAWKGESDPSIGSFFVGIDLINIPQMVIWNGSHRHWRSGPWNNRIFIGDPTMYSVYLDGFYINRDAQEDTVSMTFNYANRSSFSKYVLNYRGELLGDRWDEGRKEWVQFWSTPNDECDVYSRCGPFGSCNMLESPICSCLRGFSPKSKEEWSKGNWSGGCMRKTELQCERNSRTTGDQEKKDVFLKLEMMKVPDFAFWFAPKNVKDCEHECLKNCSCLAFAYDDGVGCMLWGGNLVDIQKFNKAGVDLYIRAAYSELDEKENAKVIIIITVIVGTFTFAICTYCSWWWIAKHRGKNKEEMEISLFDREGINKESSDSIMLGETKELNYFNFEKLTIATNNFSGEYKLGEGGFGSVYKGTLPDGHEIAVKRLSKSSTQGLEEFKNEVLVISKLQHRNLVKLLGCCIEREEKILIYEYMHNKSLDAFLFDPTKRAL